MYCIATLANKNALYDLKIFLFSLQLWNENNYPDVYIYCDLYVENFLKDNKLYKGNIFTKSGLEKYSNYDRAAMEKLQGTEFPTLFGDFVCEKMNLMNWIFETNESLLFCDADICFLGPLPEFDVSKKLILSRHEIRKRDSDKYGIYNAGFLYVNDKTIPNSWKFYTKHSTFFEQKSMENLAEEFEDSLDFFPIQNNYGWWRLLQGIESIETLKSKWTIQKTDSHSGILVSGLPLLSIHTHMKTNDAATEYFNKFVKNFLEKSNKKAKTLLAYFN